jgi:uncharacterized protein YhfF
MNGRPLFLPAGATPPTAEALRAFLADARQACPWIGPDPVCEVRWIGLDEESTRKVFQLIRARDKTGTFTLPWVVERTGQPVPQVGALLLLIDMQGRPTLLLRTCQVREGVFGRVTAEDTAVDGSPVRDPAVWVPLHTRYWNALLGPFGLAVNDDMPFWIEAFELLYDADADMDAGQAVR